MDRVGARLRAVPASRRIVIRPYDGRWPSEVATVESPLREALGDVAVRIDHIGSTSVPGYDVKDPVRDLVTVAAERWATEVAWLPSCGPARRLARTSRCRCICRGGRFNLEP